MALWDAVLLNNGKYSRKREKEEGFFAVLRKGNKQVKKITI